MRYVKSYYQGLNAGGRKCTYNSSRSSDNDSIFVFNGWVSEPILNLTPEHAGAKANNSSFDNSEYLNRAFSTSIDIYSTPDKTYYVNGILNSKGQKCIGGWSINSTRSDGSTSGKLGLIKTTTEGVDAFSVRMLYLESAYDLTELFIIKSLGFNTINHYGSVHDKFHRILVLSGFFFLKIASTFLNSSFFPKPIKRRIAI